MSKITILLVFLSFFIVSCTKKEAQNTKTKAKNSINKKNDTTKNSQKVEKKNSHKLDAKSIKAEFYEITFNFKNELASTEDFLFTVTAIPKKDKHINTDFPLSISFEDSCFKFDKKKYKAKDTKKLDKKNLVFELKSKCATKGKQELKGKLKFGYCDANMCYTYNSPFKFNINIK